MKMRAKVIIYAVYAVMVVLAALQQADVWITARSERAELDALYAKTEQGVLRLLWTGK